MSRTTIIGVHPGDRTERLLELPNSWLSAPLIWDFICRNYLGMDECPIWSAEKMQPLWNSWRNPSIPLGFRLMLMLTLDRLYIGSEHYLDASIEIANAAAKLPNPGHWPTVASFIANHPNLPGVGLWCTSVSDSPWSTYDEETETEGPPDWSTVYEIYDELASLEQPA